MKRYVVLCSLILVTALLQGMATPAKAVAPVLKRSVQIKLAVERNPKAYARTVLHRKGLFQDQYKCLVKLWTHESHWNYRAKNPNSTALGIAQLLIETSKDAGVQIRDGIRYIEYRYGSPCQAEKFWEAHYWY